MAIQESGEMYLETILILSLKGNHVRSIDLCWRWICWSPVPLRPSPCPKSSRPTPPDCTTPLWGCSAPQSPASRRKLHEKD